MSFGTAVRRSKTEHIEEANRHHPFSAASTPKVESGNVHHTSTAPRGSKIFSVLTCISTHKPSAVFHTGRALIQQVEIPPARERGRFRNNAAVGNIISLQPLLLLLRLSIVVILSILGA